MGEADMKKKRFTEQQIMGSVMGTCANGDGPFFMIWNVIVSPQLDPH